MRFLPRAWELALRALSSKDPAARGAALPPLRGGGRVAPLPLPEPAAPPQPLARRRGLRGAAGARHPPLQVRGLAGPGPAAGASARRPAGGRRPARRATDAGSASPVSTPAAGIQPIGADSPRA